MTKTIIFYTLSLILIGCDSKKETPLSNIPKYVFEVKVEDGRLFNWNEKAVIEAVIPLETTENSLLGSVDKFKIDNNRLYLFDRRNSQLLEFHDNGKFSRRIGKHGRGPGEYGEIRDFDIYGDYIYTLDYMKIHKFNKYNGEFVDTKNLEIDPKTALNPTNFIMLSDNDYYLWSSNPDAYDLESGRYFRLFLFRNGEEVARYFPFNYKIFDGPRFYQTFDNSYFMSAIDGEYDVFKVRGDSISNEFRIDFGSKSLPSDYVKNYGVLNGGDYLKHNSYKKVTNFRMLSDSYIYFNCNGPDSYIYEGLINNKTNRAIFGKMDFPINPTIIFADSVYFYGYYDPHRIKEHLNVETDNELFEEFKNMAGEILESDNPIIVKMSFVLD